MKIRNGFVSNSSSSSFLIYGASLENIDLKIISSKLEMDHDEFMDCPSEYIDKFLKGVDLDYYDCCDGEEMFIGKSWSSVKDDQTGKQFKDSIQESLKNLFEQDIKCRTHSDSN